MATKEEWYWSEEALNYWDEVDEEVGKLINQIAEQIAQSESKDTITKDDMKEIIKRVFNELAKKQSNQK